MGKNRKRHYDIYLNSSRWKNKRSLALAAAGYRCQRCGFHAERGLHVHHLGYANFGDERMEDLQVLCEECHGRLHKRPQEAEKPAPVVRPSPRRSRKPVRHGVTKKQKVEAENQRIHALQVQIKARKALT